MALLILGARGFAQLPAANAEAQAQSSITEQLESVQKQRDGIHRQVGTPQRELFSEGFFAAPWTWTMSAVRAPGVQADCDPMPDAEVSAVIDKAAVREGVSAKLVRAVVRQESGFRPCAVSVKGAQGLMQLMPATAERFHVTDPFNPAQNIDAGTRFLKELLTRYAGDLRLALGAYNAGAERVSEAGAVPDIPETQDYITNILNDLGLDAREHSPSGARSGSAATGTVSK